MGKSVRAAVFMMLAAGAGFSGCSPVRKVDHSIEKLTATLKDSDPNMRYWAAESQGHYGSQAKPAVPNLAAALRGASNFRTSGTAA